jgi:pyruvate/2-oxoglutarate dehydrogenase complex dihydrolipoamide dehydrogenase (E3) component
MNKTFDAIIIGAGQAGPSLAGRFNDIGKTVALIERDLLGGTCVNTGCTPTKALVASAKAAQMIRLAEDMGLPRQNLSGIDLAAIQRRKDAIVAKSRQGLEKWLGGMKHCTVIHGEARFVGPVSVTVSGDMLQAKQIFLNVGTRAAIPKLGGIDEVPYMTNSTILKLNVLPSHLVVVGGSYVGMEFAQMFRRFGSDVTIVERQPRLLNHEDADVSDALRAILEKEGIQIRTQAECIRLGMQDSQPVVHVDCQENAPEIVASHVLLATGRTPNTDDLGLEAAGIARDKNGYVPVNARLETAIPGVWAIGDCNGRGAFTHTSYNDYEIVAANLLDGGTRSVDDRIPCHAVYIDPPLAQVGMNEREVRERGRPALIGIRPMTKVGRAVEKGETDGFMKVLVDAETKEILGATILGTGGDEAIHCILTAMYARKPVSLLQHSVHIHPTIAELIPTVFGELKRLE